MNAYLKVHREPIKMPVTQTGCKAAMAPGKPYFVEFRSRGAQSYGHTFVFFGRLGPGNRFASYSVAGLHPKGEEASTYIQGHWAPVPAETGVSWGDLDEQYLTARFCVTLTEAEYKKVVAVIRNLQATKTTWHAGTYNCNSFGADIAKAAGLDVPNPNMYLPERFINRLAEDNSRGRKSDASVGLLQLDAAVERQRTAAEATLTLSSGFSRRGCRKHRGGFYLRVTWALARDLLRRDRLPFPRLARAFAGSIVPAGSASQTKPTSGAFALREERR